MRRLACLLVLAGSSGCSSTPDEGAILTFQTPAGELTATRVEVVLANAQAESIAEIDNQRRQPGSLASDGVRYYRQRARGGVIDGTKTVGGFELRIEPDLGASTDETFIPFAFLYDGERLIGVGSVVGPTGEPAAVEIKPGVITAYDVVVTAVHDVADEDALDAGGARVVTCSTRDQTAWRSGYAWSTATHELRLLLPDTGTDPTASDATERAADLDCDAHAADENDCDDVRGRYFLGAAESCDGLDTNCDGQRYQATGCTQSDVVCNIVGGQNGVQICDDDAGTLGACTPTAGCACSSATGGGGCARCQVVFTGATASKAACSPSVGKLHLESCPPNGCTVELAGATNGWKGYVGPMESGPFSTKLTGAPGYFYLEAKRTGTLAQTQLPVGEIYLLVTNDQGTYTLPVQMDMYATDACPLLVPGGSSSRMICSP
ncbi:MAG: putative metal-binding motif-containing protein [Myxococcales bacterium]|nr:putative metal-binding motif-containing protein [Myxococcales bacterium]